MWRSKAQFWRERLETVLTRTIPSQHVQLGKHGILESLTLPNPPPPLRFPRNEHNFTVQVFWDSDVGKWIEAASYALSHRRDADIEAKIEAIIDDLEKAQAPDGYLNCWYLQREPDKRWTNLRDNHELYNLGHLLEGGIAYFLATGRRRLLDILERYVEHVRQTFGPSPGQRRGYCGHQEIELALVKLYRLTGERKHLDLAAYFINERGRQPHYFDREALARAASDPKDFWAKSYEYNQSHKPVREQTKVVGHAVRAMYMFSAMADLAAELDDDGPEARLRGAVGRRHGLQDLHHLRARPGGRQRRLHRGLRPAQRHRLCGDLRLGRADLLGAAHAASRPRRTLCRRLGAGAVQRRSDRPVARRRALFLLQSARQRRPPQPLGLAHLPLLHDEPLAARRFRRRLLRFGERRRGRLPPLWRHLDARAARQRRGGAAGNQHLSLVRLDQHRGRAPRRRPNSPSSFAFPGWAKGAKASVNGEPVDVTAGTTNGYLSIARQWRAGDTIALELPMPPERIYAHPAVKEDIGRVALKRGPLVYCVEEIDNPGGPVQQLRLPRTASVEPRMRGDLFDGIVTLTASAEREDASGWGDGLYRSAPPQAMPSHLTAIPYYLWNNREKGSMQVWVSEA